MRRTAIPQLISVMCIAASACSGRPETPAAFEQVTGIAICDEARVRNRPQGAEKEAGIGVAYSVELQMSQECQRKFLEQVKSLQQRSPVVGGTGRKNEWIEVRMVGADRLAVLYTS